MTIKFLFKFTYRGSFFYNAKIIQKPLPVK